jgi:hypothetical protein
VLLLIYALAMIIPTIVTSHVGLVDRGSRWIMDFLVEQYLISGN